MVTIQARYEGSKKCAASHESGPALQTDAPKDIGGDASAFSPTDLVATALATCVLTTIAMFAERHELDITGATATVGKEMGTTPRRIARLPLQVTLPASIPADQRAVLERVGNGCPVHASLHPEIDAEIKYVYA